MDWQTSLGRNDGGHGCLETNSMHERKLGIKWGLLVRDPFLCVSQNDCEKTRHLPLLLLFDMTQLVFSHCPLTWHSTENNYDLISIYIFIWGSGQLNIAVLVYKWWNQPSYLINFTISIVCILYNIASGLATLLTFLPGIILSGCCPTTTCTSVFDDTFKLSSRQGHDKLQERLLHFITEWQLVF